jgi:hypothetical protein
MSALDPALRNTLENQIIRARDVSETAADAALRALATHEREAYRHHTEPQRALRRALRAKARQLGDSLERHPKNPMPALTRELAYERWHQMLFAAFLAHNHLLIHPTEKVPVTLRDCAELAPHEGDPDAWHTATRYASHMLPGIFKPHDPLLQVTFAPEHHQTLERILDDIPPPTYTSDDGLGWVYQFWQTKRKKEVNESGRKIGGADIAPVTQLFTEHYMVQFLLHNTLGAWWTTRHPNTPLPTSMSYQRTLDDGTPAAGTFDGWPNAAKDITVMDPCCGSGHFLIAAFTLLQRFRMHEEGLTQAQAGDAVLRDNLHGLELDPRCTQIAAFNLALHAWKHGGYRPLPPLNIACSGTPAGGTEHDWTNLTDDPRAKNALKRLYHLFENAPDLGSLIDPNRLTEIDPLYTAGYSEIRRLAHLALEDSEGMHSLTVHPATAVDGLAQAAALLTRQYQLVVTNVPYLSRSKHSEALRNYLDTAYPLGKGDLATAFLERCRDLCIVGGVYATVSPQNWLALKSYEGVRRELLTKQHVLSMSRLGAGAFETISGEVVNVVLAIAEQRAPKEGVTFFALDSSHLQQPQQKGAYLRESPIRILRQDSQLHNPGARIVLDDLEKGTTHRLSRFASSSQGLKTGDDPRYRRLLWETHRLVEYRYFLSTTRSTAPYAGREHVIRWVAEGKNFSRLQGLQAWNRRGVAITQMSSLPATIYMGEVFDSNVSPIVPHSADHLPALWAYCSSGEYGTAVRRLDQKMAVANATLVHVPFDQARWSAIANVALHDGLPPPYADDPTQWLFHGHPAPATEPLQVAVARLLGYRWPAETDTDMELSDEARAWITRSQDLIPHADADGIVCLPPVAGERPAAARLRDLLAHAYGDRWTNSMEATLLATVGYDGKTLNDWLWGDYFKQHCKLFNNRPFIWHIADGAKDGFSALVSYHKLDRALLERLIYTYLGSWIRQQQDATNTGTRGADLRLARAQELKTKLELILQGEKPHDIFIRWKPLHQQPIGWEPDLNDGVRLNIRPFVTAGILRNKFTINWNKDRGNDPTPNATGTTERHNDRHLTLAEKRQARAEAGA